MASTWGNHIRLSIFGESHGPAIGAVLDGLPAGEAIDMEEVLLQMKRRAPGQDRASTPRREGDAPQVLSGLLDGHTTGAPLAAVIANTNTRSGDYANLLTKPRPGHADFTGGVRYHGANDPRGGGHFSGRLTAPLVFAGAVCRQILLRRGIVIGSHAYAIAGVGDTPFDPVKVSKEELLDLSRRPFPVIDPKAQDKMRIEIEKARLDCDSVGGIVECAAAGLPAGIGSPIFDGVENRLASILFGIPAVRGVEFGAGFAATGLRGSEHNDPYAMEGGQVRTTTNRHGGALGGITSGMPLLLRVAFKPTPSIAKEQQTVDLQNPQEKQVPLTVVGRHDPCIVPRALPVVESAVAVALLDLMTDCQ